MTHRLLLCLAACAGLSACSSSHDSVPGDGTDPFANANGAGAGADDGTDPGSNDGSSDPSDPSDPGSGGSLGPAFSPLPQFPGAGTSDAADPLTNGMLCDSVPGEELPIPEAIQECFFDQADPTRLAATLEQALECAEEADTVHVRLTFHPWFVDNTYGANEIGWDPVEAAEPPMMGPGGKPKRPKGGHTFEQLVGSDHAEILFEDASGEVVMQLKLDYLSEDASQPSGYGSLGVMGGEGEMLLGDAAHVVRWATSEALNLNERGYGEYIVDSPATDELYTPNPATPEWDYRVVYEAWISLEAFGDAGFGGAKIEFVHASPSKAESNTIEVEPGDCPPPPCSADPDAPCGDTETPPPGEQEPPCSSDPDAPCGDSDLPDAGTPIDCLEIPDDPRCRVD